jgi:ABC-2 type transport system ATP-binding protein
MKDLILELKAQGKTVIMCSHRLEDVQDVATASPSFMRGS